jgi:hypothetical protein
MLNSDNQAQLAESLAHMIAAASEAEGGPPFAFEDVKRHAERIGRRMEDAHPVWAGASDPSPDDLLLVFACLPDVMRDECVRGALENP